MLWEEQLIRPIENINKPQIGIAIAALLLGTLLYLVERPPDSVFFIEKLGFNISLYNKVPSLFGTLGNNFPAFIHVFSFSLLTAGLIDPDRYRYFFICIFWFLTNSLFELGQKYPAAAIKMLPCWMDGVPVLGNTRYFFANGTFDYYDIIAFAAGGIAAYGVLMFTENKELAT